MKKDRSKLRLACALLPGGLSSPRAWLKHLQRGVDAARSGSVIARGMIAMIAAAGIITAIDRAAYAQDFPTRAVRIVVPTTPGGTLDFVSRLLAQKLNESWSQAVVVDNRAGAGGIIGYDIAARANPDGHTIVVVASTFTVTASVHKKLPYDAVRDFAPVTLLVFAPWVLVVHPSLPARSVKELVAFTKERPGQINYASTGSGGATHLAAEMLRSMTGADITHVPYKGTMAAVNDVVSGRVQLAITGLTAAMPQAKAGKLRVLAVTGKNRSAAAPDVPRIGESVPGYEYNNWFGVLAPRSTPARIVQQLNENIVRALHTADVRKVLLGQSMEIAGTTPGQFGKMIQQEIEKYTALANTIGVQIE
ncbi:MAG: tripartite tricarboxylate transporter substrate binding protein [Betaproteobacteria bacterium]|nr:tripartite tricarboxylate transporter substrate binding protein [Betaproteobacteria bacterium]